jgi:hypothetical protein
MAEQTKRRHAAVVAATISLGSLAKSGQRISKCLSALGLSVGRPEQQRTCMARRRRRSLSGIGTSKRDTVVAIPQRDAQCLLFNLSHTGAQDNV